MKRRLLISFFCVVTLFFIMRWHGAGLITPQSPRGIIDLEFAGTAERLKQLQFFWDIQIVIQNIYLDFLFIIAYCWFLHSVCLATRNQYSSLFSGMAVAGGAFDVLENFLMMLVINARFGPPVLPVIFYCAIIKFALLGLVVLFLILSLFGLFRAKPAG